MHNNTSKLKKLKVDTLIGLILLIVLVVAPVAQIMATSIFPEEGFNLLAPIQVILKGNLIKPFVNTLILGICVVLGASLIATPIAYMSAKTEIGKHKWLDIVLMIPFMTPPYIGSMGWILFVQSNGFLNQLIPATKGFDQFFFSFFGLVLIMSLHLFPFIYLILKNALMRVSGSLDEAAVVHGAGFIMKLKKVTLPLMIAAYVSGSLLVFVKTIGEFGTPATFGRKIGFKVLTSEIHHYVSSWPISFSKATSLSYFLLITCVLIWYIQSQIEKKHTYKTIGGKGIKVSEQPLKLWQKILCYGFIAIALLIAIGVPYFSIISTSLLKLRGYGLQWNNLTFDHYIAIFESGSKSLEAFITSLKVALISATLCSVLGIFISLIAIYRKGALSKLVDLLGLLPNMIPAIVLVLGLILFWNASFMKIPIYNTFWMIILTYVTFYIPFSVQYIKSSLSQVSDTLLEAGEVFGGSRWYNFKQITLPLIVPGIVAGWSMTFTIAFRELVGALMILPPGMETSSTYIFGQFEQGEASMGMAMAVISVLMTITMLTIINGFIDRKVKSGS